MYLMCLNVSNRQISTELGVGKNVAQNMTSLIRNEVMLKTPEPALYGEVEIDEAYVISGHKGQRRIVWRRGRVGRRNRLRGARGRGTLMKENPHVFGMVQRCGMS